jgi:hypothetical protein
LVRVLVVPQATADRGGRDSGDSLVVRWPDDQAGAGGTPLTLHAFRGADSASASVRNDRRAPRTNAEFRSRSVGRRRGSLTHLPYLMRAFHAAASISPLAPARSYLAWNECAAASVNGP